MATYLLKLTAKEQKLLLDELTAPLPWLAGHDQRRCSAICQAIVSRLNAKDKTLRLSSEERELLSEELSEMRRRAFVLGHSNPDRHGDIGRFDSVLKKLGAASRDDRR
jgi:hypothetical protein